MHFIKNWKMFCRWNLRLLAGNVPSERRFAVAHRNECCKSFQRWAGKLKTLVAFAAFKSAIVERNEKFNEQHHQLRLQLSGNNEEMMIGGKRSFPGNHSTIAVITPVSIAPWFHALLTAISKAAYLWSRISSIIVISSFLASQMAHITAYVGSAY